MKKRNPLAVFFLSIITLGIYDLYWLVQTKKVLNEKTSHHTPSIWLLIVPVPVIIVGYILLFAKAGVKTTTTVYGQTTFNNGTTDQISHPGAALLAFGLIFVGFFASFIIGIIWYYKFSKAINEYTQGKMSTAMSFLILWLIHLIGVALIQDTFNDMQDGAAPIAYNQNQSPQQPLPPPPSPAGV
jgi:uncharacterized membrane protein YjgN (DUF898 family)